MKQNSSLGSKTTTANPVIQYKIRQWNLASEAKRKHMSQIESYTSVPKGIRLVGKLFVSIRYTSRLYRAVIKDMELEKQ